MIGAAEVTAEAYAWVRDPNGTPVEGLERKVKAVKVR